MAAARANRSVSACDRGPIEALGASLWVTAACCASGPSGSANIASVTERGSRAIQFSRGASSRHRPSGEISTSRSTNAG